mgnify:CR=1 FL=1
MSRQSSSSNTYFIRKWMSNTNPSIRTNVLEISAPQYKIYIYIFLTSIGRPWILIIWWYVEWDWAHGAMIWIWKGRHMPKCRSSSMDKHVWCSSQQCQYKKGLVLCHMCRSSTTTYIFWPWSSLGSFVSKVLRASNSKHIIWGWENVGCFENENTEWLMNPSICVCPKEEEWSPYPHKLEP